MAKKSKEVSVKKKKQSVKVKLPKPMPFDEFMDRIVRVKPPKEKEI